MKENIVEIPEGSGNKYRYSYEDGQTVYKGPVGSAPDLGEAEFLMGIGEEDKRAKILRDGLPHFYGTSKWYKTNPIFRNFYHTDGAEFVAKEGDAYWLLDAIASHQMNPKVEREPFQVWTLKVKDNEGVLTATDGGKWDPKIDDEKESVIARQEIDYTDFPLDEIKFWVEQGMTGTGREGFILMLPSER